MYKGSQQELELPQEATLMTDVTWPALLISGSGRSRQVHQINLLQEDTFR